LGYLITLHHYNTSHYIVTARHSHSLRLSRWSFVQCSGKFSHKILLDFHKGVIPLPDGITRGAPPSLLGDATASYKPVLRCRCTFFVSYILGLVQVQFITWKSLIWSKLWCVEWKLNPTKALTQLNSTQLNNPCVEEQVSSQVKCDFLLTVMLCTFLLMANKFDLI